MKIILFYLIIIVTACPDGQIDFMGKVGNLKRQQAHMSKKTARSTKSTINYT